MRTNKACGWVFFTAWLVATGAAAAAPQVPAPPASSAKDAPPGTLPAAWTALQAVPEVVAVACSGPLPGAEKNVAAFVRQQGQWTLGNALARIRQDYGRRLGLDPLDATALQQAGLLPQHGVCAVSISGSTAPLLLARLANETSFRAGRLGDLQEEEGPGELVAERTARGQAWIRARRRFGEQRRDAGGYALLPQQEVLWAPAGGERALLTVLQQLPTGNAATAPGPSEAPVEAKALPQASTFWQRGAWHPSLGRGASVALQFSAKGVLANLWAPAGANAGNAAATALADAAADLGPDAGPQLLAEAWVTDRERLRAQIDFARAPDLLRRAAASAGQPALTNLSQSLTEPLALLAQPAFAPVARLLARHNGPLWLRAFAQQTPGSPRPMGWVVATRLDGEAAQTHLAHWVAETCAPLAGKALPPAKQRLRGSCQAQLTSPRGRATVLALPGASAGQGSTEVVAVDRWLLLGSDRPSVVRALATLPAAGAKPARPLADAGQAWPAALWQASSPADATGTVFFAAASTGLQAALTPQGAAGWSQGPLGMLPQLLLAGPLGDALRELGALGQLHWRLHQSHEGTRGVARLEAEN